LLRKRVLDAVVSPRSKRNYARALDDLFAFCASRPSSRSNSCGHSSIQTTDQTTERYLGSDQEIAVAINDNLGL
jgi:hypothetical protein